MESKAFNHGNYTRDYSGILQNRVEKEVEERLQSQGELLEDMRPGHREPWIRAVSLGIEKRWWVWYIFLTNSQIKMYHILE